MFIKKLILDSIRLLPGWHTNRKIIVFESDDWGSIRMPSKKTYDYLLKKGVPVDQSRYTQYDSLANEEDLSALFEVFNTVKDKNNRTVVFTPFSLVANPDFEKIKENDFRDYYYKELPFTLSKYSEKHTNAFNLWKEGIENGFFQPQFHGREHLNVYSWLKALQENSKITRLGFENKMYGLTDNTIKRSSAYLAAFEFYSEKEFNTLGPIISDGTKMFEKIFGYRAESFMAPCASWSRMIEPALKESGIKFIHAGVIQSEPKIDGEPDDYKKIIRFTGQKSNNDLTFIGRNCSFEPSGSNLDWVDICLASIKKAFLFRKPAIIHSHRVNFIGNIFPENRTRGLKEFKKLLIEIKKRWPDVEFLSSSEFGRVVLGRPS